MGIAAGVGVLALALGIFVYHVAQDDGETVKVGDDDSDDSGEEVDENDFYNLLPVEREADGQNLDF